MQINKLTILLAILFFWGCGQSENQKSSGAEQAPKKEQVEAPKQQNTPVGAPDKFGRSPGDPHYGHDHPSQEPSNQPIDSIQKPASGEVDQFGRKPGDPHYGHNHQ